MTCPFFNKQIYVTTTVKSGRTEMAEDKTFTQEEVNALIGKARQEGKEVGKKEFEGWISPNDLSAKLSELTDQISTLTGEKEALQTQLTEKDGKIAKYETDSVKTKVARELGLSYEAVDFIQGDSEEAIRQSAETLKGLVSSKFVPPQYNPEQGKGGDPKEEAFRKLSRELKGE